jgi:hypothetical protein
MTFRSSYSDHNPSKYATSCGGESKTQQQFADDADVNNILSKCVRTGVIHPGVGELPPEQLYADVVEYQSYDYQQALDMVMDAERSFQDLPAKVRRHYNDSPHEFLQAVQNGDEYLYEAGLATKPKPEPEPDPKKEPQDDKDTPA